ncbi:MAG: 2-oxo acid dehydrogenase subunit E2, partial [Bdellovibrionales bacterium]|nr:2-oxo acid dehydrogenase subunit E2 [Bdellovibrionales bacterium]
ATLAGQPVSALGGMTQKAFSSFEDERIPLRGIRRKIAEKMQMAKRVIPHFSLLDEANVTELVKFRAQLKDQLKDKDVKVTFLPFVMKAVIATSREFPMFNASIDDDAGEIVYHKNFNVGFAADTPNGLVVPVIKNADQKTILEISKEIVVLATKAREGKLSVEDMQGATISITNIGSIGGNYATPIINHPEVAIIGMYKIKRTPVFVGEEIHAADIMNVSCTADHRLIDGAVAARFLTAMVKRLENPSLLMMDMM